MAGSRETFREALFGGAGRIEPHDIAVGCGAHTPAADLHAQRGARHPVELFHTNARMQCTAQIQTARCDAFGHGLNQIDVRAVRDPAHDIENGVVTHNLGVIVVARRDTHGLNRQIYVETDTLHLLLFVGVHADMAMRHQITDEQKIGWRLGQTGAARPLKGIVYRTVFHTLPVMRLRPALGLFAMLDIGSGGIIIGRTAQRAALKFGPPQKHLVDLPRQREIALGYAAGVVRYQRYVHAVE
jgi:hypothetical protein